MCSLCLGNVAIVRWNNTCILRGEAYQMLGCLIGGSCLQPRIGDTRSLELWCWWILHLMLVSYFFCLLDHFADLLFILPQQWLLWFFCDWLSWICWMLSIHRALAGVTWESLIHVLSSSSRLTWVPLLQYFSIRWTDLRVLEGHCLFLISLARDWSLLLGQMMNHMDWLFVFCGNSIFIFGFSAWIYQTPIWMWSIVLTPLTMLAATTCFHWTKNLRIQFIGRIAIAYAC